MILGASVFLLLVVVNAVAGFSISGVTSRSIHPSIGRLSSTVDDSIEKRNATIQVEADVNVERTSASSPPVDRNNLLLKEELLRLAVRTNRGFQATAADRKIAKDIIFDLATRNPTAYPASSYYDGASISETEEPTLAGKWTLVYTDAPDITGLDTSGNPFSSAELGRIGQLCSPPYIKNVIEWRRPQWAKNLPFSGSDNSRILQKVVTLASAVPEQPKLVNLKVAGLEVDTANSEDDSSPRDFSTRIQEDGLLAGFLSANPIDLKGPLKLPFGQFEILYLDDDFRMIKTYQNYLAVNTRIKSGEEWF